MTTITIMSTRMVGIRQEMRLPLQGRSPTHAPYAGHQHHEAEPWRPARNSALSRGEGKGCWLFIDAQASGCAGDMLCAALLDLGVPVEAIRDELSKLQLPGYDVRVVRASRSGIVAPRFVVLETSPQPARDYRQIRELLEAAPIDPPAKVLALEAFRCLAVAEAAVHGMTVDTVHFHEVGAVDSIVDIVAASVGLAYLGVDRVVSSPLPVGSGIIRGAAHGPLPGPPPAMLSVICEARIPTFDAGTSAELVTPTGACIVAAAASEFCRWPSFAPERCSYGSGTKDFRDRPNLVRLVLGRPSKQ